MQVAVIGAGIVGINCAHALLDEGHGVTLIDPKGIAEETSFGNAGFIAHTDIIPLASPKVWRHVPRWLLDPVGPMSIRPAYLPKILPWMLRFIAASSPARIEASTQALIALNGGTLAAWERRLDQLGLKGAHLRSRGYFYVFSNEADFRAARPSLERQRSLGIPVEILGGPALRKLEPALSERCVGAALYPTGAHVSNPKGIADAIGKAALGRGAKLVLDKVATIAPTPTGARLGLASGGSIEPDAVIVAAGAWSKPLAAQLGDHVPLDTERGYNLTMPKGSLGLSRPIIFEGQGIATSCFDDCDRVGGAVEFAGTELPPNYRRVDAILARLERLVPNAKTDEGTRWMGFRPSLPDSLPVIGRSKASPHIVYAFGHAHHGLTQSAFTGDLAAALVGQRRTAIDLAPFSADRF